MPRTNDDRPLYYMLDEAGEPYEAPDVLTWGLWFETAQNRTIAQDRDEAGGEDVMVSTVFLGLDHNFSGDGPPVLWETLVFGGVLDGAQRRYTSRAAALAGHQAICQDVAAVQRRRTE